MSPLELDVAALLMVRDRRVLMVRSRGRDKLYLPGGKVEAGETGLQAAVREAREETALDLAPDDLVAFATVVEPAHDQPEGTIVRMRLYLLLPGRADNQEPQPSAEVDEVHWTTSLDAGRCPPAGVETLRLLVDAGLID